MLIEGGNILGLSLDCRRYKTNLRKGRDNDIKFKRASREIYRGMVRMVAMIAIIVAPEICEEGSANSKNIGTTRKFVVFVVGSKNWNQSGFLIPFSFPFLSPSFSFLSFPF